MAEQWIDAATAVGIVITRSDDHAGMRALCARAHNGLVRARARLFVATEGKAERRIENAPVPKAFWWAGGHEALTQNWTSGDFSTWIDRKVHLQAYGVTFALNGILDMLSADRRVLIARSLSVAGSAAWIAARDAIEMLKSGERVREPIAFLTEHARLGLVAGRAIEARRFEERQVTELVWDEREWDIPAWFWDPASRLQGHEDWELGQFGAVEPGSIGTGWIKLSGVHFLTELITEVLPPPAIDPFPETGNLDGRSKAGVGGRPPQSWWWDDMWCDVWGLIHQGDFKPEKQADVERAMLTWASRNGHTLSEATARPKARKLFSVYKGEATNFLAD